MPLRPGAPSDGCGHCPRRQRPGPAHYHARGAVLGKRTRACSLRPHRIVPAGGRDGLVRAAALPRRRAGLSGDSGRTAKGSCMSPTAELNTLRERKRELLVASEVQRRVLAVECAALQDRFAWLKPSIDFARRLQPLAGFALPLYRAWAARNADATGPRSWLKTLASALPVAMKFATAFAQFRSR